MNYLLVMLVIIFTFSIFLTEENMVFDYAYSEPHYNVQVIDFPGKPSSAVVDEKTNLIYVTDFFSGKLVVIDGNSDRIIDNINMTKTAFGVGINPTTNMIYVGSEFANVLNVVNVDTYKIEEKIPMITPYDIAVNPNKNIIYITSDKSNSVFVLDGDTHKMITKFNVTKPCGIAVNSKTGMVYVTSESENLVQVFDAENNFVTKINVGESPRGVTVNELTNMVYVTNQKTDTISVIDGSKNVVTDSVEVGDVPRRVVAHYQTNLIYVTNQGSNNISVINGTDNKVIKTIPVNEPFEIVINQNTGTLYAMYFGNNVISVIKNSDAKQDDTHSFTKSNVSYNETKKFGSITDTKEFPELGIKVETIAENLEVPWEIDFASDGRIFFTERIGNLRIIENGVISEPIISLKVSGTEGGLLGLALDPNFEENHYLYLYYSYYDSDNIDNRMVRYTESENKLSDELMLLDKIPGSKWHDGGRIKFGPDGKLYITTGDAGDRNLSQRLDSVSGKILRINSDGSIPDDNPFPDSAVYSYGHRNPQGIDWDKSGVLIATEHGPSGHDEINLIKPGKNYGWPVVIGDETKDGMTNPVLHSGDDTWAPSGASFYYGEISQWDGLYFAASLRGQHLLTIEFDSEYNVISYEKLFLGEYGRLRDVVNGPDGLYVLTSNQDGRGTPSHNDDRILRITPLETNLEKDYNSLSPLKQVQLGILSQNISCKEGLELVIKASNEMPACVKTSSVQKLVDIGWAIN